MCCADLLVSAPPTPSVRPFLKQPLPIPITTPTSPTTEKPENLGYSFDKYADRKPITLGMRGSPHEKRFDNINKFPLILSSNRKIATEINIKQYTKRNIDQFMQENISAIYYEPNINSKYSTNNAVKIKIPVDPPSIS